MMYHFRAQNGPFVLNILFSVKKHYYFHLQTGLFQYAKFKNTLTWIQSYDDVPFLGQKWSICPKQFFLKFNNTILIYLQALLFCKILKNSSSGSRVMRMHHFWAQNGPFSQNEDFFKKPVSKPCFFHSCLSTCQKSKSVINL